MKTVLDAWNKKKLTISYCFMCLEFWLKTKIQIQMCLEFCLGPDIKYLNLYNIAFDLGLLMDMKQAQMIKFKMNIFKFSKPYTWQFSDTP